jgi:glyoxylase-like metal-dependent hydrolase (beta-lactamase superfamily II)
MTARRAGADPLAGLTVLERGWLSSTNVLIHAAAGESGAVLVDSSHTNHAAQTVSLVRQALGGAGAAPLARVLNTHLHSDHCGGNAALQRAFDVPVGVPPGEADAAAAWDESRLSHHLTNQRLTRFRVDGLLSPAEPLVAGGREWDVIEAPGHDAHAVMLFDAAAGVLISADALWRHGFGVVFPELAGEPGFDDVEAVLDRIARLPVRLVVPGHGAVFDEVVAALAEARARLAAFRADPRRHARHAVKVLLKYHLMEQGTEPIDALMRWAAATPLVVAVGERFAAGGAIGADAWVRQQLAELVEAGVLRRVGDTIVDA